MRRALPPLRRLRKAQGVTAVPIGRRSLPFPQYNRPDRSRTATGRNSFSTLAHTHTQSAMLSLKNGGVAPARSKAPLLGESTPQTIESPNASSHTLPTTITIITQRRS